MIYFLKYGMRLRLQESNQNNVNRIYILVSIKIRTTLLISEGLPIVRPDLAY